MRAITTDLKAIVSRLGPVVSKALEGAIKRAVSAQHAEVTSDHLLRALLDLPDSDLCVSMTEAHVERRDVVARLDWHLGRLYGKHEGKPRFAHPLCLLLEDAGKLTRDPVRSGHVAAALLADPSLSSADIANLLAPLPRLSLHLLASRLEDHGEVGRTLAPTAAAPAASSPAESPRFESDPGDSTPAVSKPGDSTPAVPGPTESAPPAQAPAASKPIAPALQAAPQADAAAPEMAAPVGTSGKSPANASALRTLFADRLVAEDAGGLTLSARVEGRDTTLRLEWDAGARVIVLRIAVPGAPPADAVRTAVALSTLNNAIPHGTFVVDGARLAFRSHVFLDAEGNAPLETLAFAVRTCEEAAEALG